MSVEPTGTPLVEVDDLRKYFVRRGGDKVPAIDGISLSVESGEFVVLLGPSGCGKTTLLRCLAGLEQPDDGQIKMRGQTYFSTTPGTFVPPEQRNLSMVFQSYALWPHMTIFNNVAFPLRNRKVPKADIPARVTAALDRVGVADLADSYPSQVSGGQQQRVALARALVTNDELILFDEPLSNVDARVRDELRFELLELQRQVGFAAVYVTHDQGEAMAMADRIAVLGRGKVLQLGAPQDVYLRPNSLEVARFIGNVNQVPARAIDVHQDGTVTLDTQIGKVLATIQDRDIQAGDDVTVIWRPEDARIGARSSIGEVNSWQAKVVASVFVGAHTEADLQVGSLKQRIWNVSKDIPASGADTTLAVLPSDMLAYRA